MPNPNPYFELVRTEGKHNEQVLCVSKDKYLLNELKVEYIRKRNPRTDYIVRPQVVRIYPQRSIN